MRFNPKLGNGQGPWDSEGRTASAGRHIMKRAILSPSSEAAVVTVPCDGLPLPGSCERLSGGRFSWTLSSFSPTAPQGAPTLPGPQRLGQALRPRPDACRLRIY